MRNSLQGGGTQILNGMTTRGKVTAAGGGITDAGTPFSTFADGKGGVGAQTVTSVSAPAHAGAIITFHWYDDAGGETGPNSATVVLGGVAATQINKVSGGGSLCSVSCYVCIGAGSGSHTLAWTNLGVAMEAGPNISITYLDGIDTSTPIGTSSTATGTGTITASSLTFDAGDRTMIVYTSDPNPDPTNAGANTETVAEHTGDSLHSGMAWKAGATSISISSGSAAAVIGFTLNIAP
jgi:hypothetical protein